MAKKKKDIFEDDEEYIAPPEERIDEIKFMAIRKKAFISTAIFVVIYLVVVIGFRYDKDLMNTIVAWFCLFEWILPIFWFQMRYYKFSLHVREEEKIAKLYTIIMVFLLFVWASCLGALIFALRVDVPTLLTSIIEGVFFFGLIPSIILVIIIQR